MSLHSFIHERKEEGKKNRKEMKFEKCQWECERYIREIYQRQFFFVAILLNFEIQTQRNDQNIFTW